MEDVSCRVVNSTCDGLRIWRETFAQPYHNPLQFPLLYVVLIVLNAFYNYRGVKTSADKLRDKIRVRRFKILSAC